MKPRFVVVKQETDWLLCAVIGTDTYWTQIAVFGYEVWARTVAEILNEKQP